MSAVNFILSLARKILARESKGITKIPTQMAVEQKAGEIAARLQDAGLPLNRADEFIRSEQDLVRVLNLIESTPPVTREVPSGIRSTQTAKVFDMQGKEIPQGSKIMGGKAVDEQDSLIGSLDEFHADFVKETGINIPKENLKQAYDIKKSYPSTTPIVDKNGKFIGQEATQKQYPESKKFIVKEPDELNAEIKARLEAQNKSAVKKIRERKNRENVFGLEDYDTTNMSEIKKEIIRTEAKLGNLNSDDPDFRAKAKPLIDKITALQKKLREDKADGGRAGFANGTGAPSIKLFPRARGREVEQEVGPGIKISQRDIDYGITGLLQGDKFFGGAEIDKGKVKVDVVSPDGDTLFKDTISKDDAVNFILGAGDPRGDKFQIKTDKDFKNMQVIFKKTFNQGGRVGLKVGSSLKFLQKVFGKDRFEEIRKTDPEMYTGLLEVVEMYRKRDKEGLKMYLQRFLPHMDDAQIEEFIRGSDGSEGLVGELIRLGSGRDYAGKIDMIKRAEEMRKLDDLEITEKMIRKPNADGGIMRLGLKEGSGMTRRTFLKILGGAMSIPIIGKFLKPFRTAKGVTKVPMIKTDNVPGKPEWFDQLVNKVIIEGDDVTKKFATAERQSIHQKTLDDGSVVRVTEDVDDGAIRVEYQSEKNVFGDDVQLEYKKPLPDEGDPRPSAEFTTAESGPVGRQSGPDDFDIDVDEVGGTSIRDLDSDVSKLKEYATGKKPTMTEIVQNKKRRDKAKAISEDPEAQSDAVIRRQGEYTGPFDDDFASGGIARMLGE